MILHTSAAPPAARPRTHGTDFQVLFDDCKCMSNADDANAYHAGEPAWALGPPSLARPLRCAMSKSMSRNSFWRPILAASGGAEEIVAIVNKLTTRAELAEVTCEFCDACREERGAALPPKSDKGGRTIAGQGEHAGAVADYDDEFHGYTSDPISRAPRAPEDVSAMKGSPGKQSRKSCNRCQEIDQEIARLRLDGKRHREDAEGLRSAEIRISQINKGDSTIAKAARACAI
jgi:hypothetical protein